MHMTPPVISSRHALAVLAAACLVSACASVNLDQRYDPPPVRMPEPLPSTSPQPITPPGAQSQPVTPAQPMPQVLPPLGQTPAAPVSSLPADPATSAASDPVRPDAHLVTFSSQLDGASAIPPTRSNGQGKIDALYDSNTRLLRWIATWSGLSGVITGVQFHGPAGAEQTAPPTMVWPGPFGPRYEGRATLTPQQAVDFLDGRWYISITTNVYPSGELRGQMRVVR